MQLSEDEWHATCDIALQQCALVKNMNMESDCIKKQEDWNETCRKLQFQTENNQERKTGSLVGKKQPLSECWVICEEILNEINARP